MKKKTRNGLKRRTPKSPKKCKTCGRTHKTRCWKKYEEKQKAKKAEQRKNGGASFTLPNTPKEKIMSVEAGKAIWFECEKCDKGQYADYSLDSDWEDDRAVNADNIMCEHCGHDNRVIEEL